MAAMDTAFVAARNGRDIVLGIAMTMMMMTWTWI